MKPGMPSPDIASPGGVRADVPPRGGAGVTRCDTCGSVQPSLRYVIWRMGIGRPFACDDPYHDEEEA